MNSNERFGQIEAMLADLLRRMDRQAEQMDRQAKQMDRQAEQMDRQAEQMDQQSDQIDDIIGILKISDARQTRAEERQTRAEERQDRFEERQEAMLTEVKRQGNQLEILLQTQVKMMDLMVHNAARTDELERKMPAIVAYEARFQRLEDAVFKKAS